jgi:hypothetical protein
MKSQPKQYIQIVTVHGTYAVHRRWLAREYWRIIKNMIENGSSEGYVEATRR